MINQMRQSLSYLRPSSVSIDLTTDSPLILQRDPIRRIAAGNAFCHLAPREMAENYEAGVSAR